MNIFNITGTGTEGVTITGSGANSSLTKTSGAGLYGTYSGILVLGPETRVTLTNITITTGSRPGRGITLNGGNLTLGNGCKVINNINPYLDATNGGGGIYAGPGSVLTLEDGCEVSGNTVKGPTFGAGIATKESTLVINGGFISNNKWVDRINGLRGGSGVYLENSTFTMQGGQISGNVGFYGGGVDAFGSSSVTLAGGLITENTALQGGGGLRVGGPFIMKDGAAITNNVATGEANNYGYGGAIEVGGHSVMDGGSISGNKAKDEGGGVRVMRSSASFTMNGGDITDNAVTDGYGGGGVATMDAAFTMNGGVIAKNTVTARTGQGAQTWAGKGGGVCASSFTMNGGTIYGSDDMGGSNANKASKDDFGHAVYVYTYVANASAFKESGLLNGPSYVARDGTITSYP
jgi:hypothetical protein